MEWSAHANVEQTGFFDQENAFQQRIFTKRQTFEANEYSSLFSYVRWL